MTTPHIGGAIFADDGMFSEPTMRSRAEQSIVYWGRGSRLLLGVTSFSRKKLSVGGKAGRRASSVGVSC